MNRRLVWIGLVVSFLAFAMSAARIAVELAR